MLRRTLPLTFLAFLVTLSSSGSTGDQETQRKAESSSIHQESESRKTMPLTRINHFSAKPGSGDALHALIESFLPMIRDSKGCLKATLMRSVDDPDQIVVIEVWSDKDSHRASAANVPAGTFEKAMALMADPPEGAYYQ